MNVAQILKKKNLATIATIAAELEVSYGYCVRLIQQFAVKPNGRILSGGRGAPQYTYSRSEVNRFKRKLKASKLPSFQKFS